MCAVWCIIRIVVDSAVVKVTATKCSVPDWLLAGVGLNSQLCQIVVDLFHNLCSHIICE